MIATPQTIGNEIQEKLRALYYARDTFLSEAGTDFVALYDELERLGKVDGARRSLLLARLYGLTGNRTQAEVQLENCRKLHVNQFTVALNQLMLLVNLGYYRDSVPVLRVLSDPTSGALCQILEMPPGNGAFHLLSSILEQANTMRLLNIPASAAAFTATSRIMDQWGDTDEDYANALEIAGTIMRERKLLHRETLAAKPVESPPDGGFGYVKLSYTVGVDLDTAIDMTCEYTHRLSISRTKIPPSMIFEFEAAE